MYHNVTLNLIGKGGNEASTLRVRFVAFRLFVKFLRRRHVFAGMDRKDIKTQYVHEWNEDFIKMTAQRRTDFRKIKIKCLMTPMHVIKYGRSELIENIAKKLRDLGNEKLCVTKRFTQHVRGYLISKLCIMNDAILTVNGSM